VASLPEENIMTDTRPGLAITRVLSDFLDVSSGALRMLAADAGPADAWLVMRRAAECQFGAGPGSVSAEDFRGVSRTLRRRGEHDEAFALESMVATTSQLENAGLDWSHRYDDGRVAAQGRADMDLVARGRVRRGLRPCSCTW
jgi:hypothetical protein